MTQVVYDGAQPARTVVLPSGKQIRANKGEPVDVPADVAKSLCEQRDWKRSSKTQAEPKSDAPDSKKEKE